MAASTHMLSVVIDVELEQAIEYHVACNKHLGLKKSAVVRDLLRRALSICSSERDLGWREGHAAAAAAMRETLQRAISATPSFDPGPNYDPGAFDPNGDPNT